MNEYCENYNRFSGEFPELLGNEETKQELLSRVDALSQQLWENIKARKDEAMRERLSYMEGGWVQVEMIKLAGAVARLIENEFNRFTAISAVVTGHVINESVDLDDVAKRLTERGVEVYVENEEDRALMGKCPQLQEIASTILAKVDALFSEQHVLSLDQTVVQVLNVERQNFSSRLNALVCWASLILHEISTQALQVFDVLDDWVVIAVKRENQACQLAVKEIAAAIEAGEMHIPSVLLQSADLKSNISLIEFFDGPPAYMQSAHPAMVLEETRISLDSLLTLRAQFKQHLEDRNLLDAQTFTSLMLLNVQSQLLPNVWQFIPFERIFALLKAFQATPISDNPNAGTQQMFRRKSMSLEDEERFFVDSRALMLILCLVSSELPTHDQKEDYISKLKFKAESAEDKMLTKELFVKVSQPRSVW